MTSDDNVIDAEVVEMDATPNLPAVADDGGTHGAQPSIEGRDWSTYSRPERRCTAHSSRTGDQCKNVAIKGHNVCRYHGGAAPQIKQAARIRLENAADLMAKQLLGIALAGDTDSVKLAAIRDALDRAGLKPPAEVFVSQGEPRAWETVFEGIYSGPEGETPSVSPGHHAAGVDAPMPPAPAHAQESMYPQGFADAGESAHQAADRDHGSAPDDPPPSPRPRDRDRHRPDQPPSRHITGEDAMRAANWANRAMAESHGLPWGESDRRRR